MNPKETFRALMDAIQAGDFVKAQSYIAPDDFFCVPSLSIIAMVLTCPWMDIGTRLKSAFPDLDYQFNIEGVDGNIVKFSTQLKGTHTGDLDLKVLNMGVVPVTRTSLATDREYGIATVRDGRVIAWAMESMKCANIFTLLEQLDVGPRSMQVHW